MGLLSTFVSSAMDTASSLFAAVQHEDLSVLPSSGAVKEELSLLSSATQDLSRLMVSVATNRAFVWALVLYIAYRIYSFFFCHVRRVVRNHETGYITSEREQELERAQAVRRRRKTGDLPPVYPNGWFFLMPSHELPKKGVRQVHALGLELAVFRTAEGKLGVLDAYCPHLGANIAAGGVVENDTIKCPFHGWEFNCEGSCTRIPYAAEVPSTARVKSYTSMEINDQILLWHDAEGRAPSWTPPDLKFIDKGDWSYRGKTQHFLNCHIQEVPENAADVAHLNYLHGPALLNGTDLRNVHRNFKFIRHTWDASWSKCEEEDKKHMSVLLLTHHLEILGWKCPLLDFHVVATQIGPGLVYLTWESMFGKGVFLQGLTPQEPLLQEITHCIYGEWRVPTIVAKFYMLGEAAQVERDIMVWNNKMYRKSPLLVKEDGLIRLHRMWYSQFYSENSPRFEDLKDTLNW